MRYFLLVFALSVVVVMAMVGKRGSTSRNPPIEIFSDMDRQGKLRPQTVNNDLNPGLKFVAHCCL